MTNLKSASLIIGTSMMELNEVNSTNIYASNLLKHTNPIEGTVVFTLNQTAGQGQYGSNWVSEKGKNITISIMLYPKWLEPEKQFFLNQAVSLGVHDFLSNYAENVRIKWPNDILVDGKKIGGILIENTLNGNQIKNTVVGIGINVNQTSFGKDLQSKVTSLKLLKPDDTFDLRALVGRLARALDARYLQLKNKNYETICAEYKEVLFALNEDKKFKSGDEVFAGRITGVNEQGLLTVEDKAKKKSREFSNKQISFA